MFGHLPELGLILLIALIVFGPERLPEVARNVGKFMGDARRAVDMAINPEEHEVPEGFSTYYYESLARSGEAPAAEWDLENEGETEEEESETIYWTREDTSEDVLGAPYMEGEAETAPRRHITWS